MMTTNPLTIDAPEGLPYVETTRDFDAPVAALWRAHTDPDLLARWLGPDGTQTTDMHIDVRPGGSWGFTHRGPDGGEAYEFRGVLHDVREHQEIVRTFEFGGVPGHVSLERLRFEDLGEGRTRLRAHCVYQSVEDRDGMVGADMERGMREGYERLDRLVAAG